MSDVSNVNGGSSITGPNLGIGAGLSADTLLAYVQTQLGGLDGELGADMQQQETQLNERKAIESAQSTFEQFGTKGPQNVQDFQSCLAAIDKSIASLPEGDPTRANLQDFRQSICDKYGYGMQEPTIVVTPYALSSQEEEALRQQLAQPVLKNPPGDGDWQGTSDTLANMGNDIKSNADLQMIQIQDLVSQRQQAIQLATGILGKQEQTLEAEAKNIGG